MQGIAVIRRMKLAHADDASDGTFTHAGTCKRANAGLSPSSDFLVATDCKDGKVCRCDCVQIGNEIPVCRCKEL